MMLMETKSLDDIENIDGLAPGVVLKWKDMLRVSLFLDTTHRWLSGSLVECTKDLHIAT